MAERGLFSLVASGPTPSGPGSSPWAWGRASFLPGGIKSRTLGPVPGAGELRLAFLSHHPGSRHLPSLLAVGSVCLPLAPMHPIPESSRPRGLLPWGKLPRFQGLGRMPSTLPATPLSNRGEFGRA